MLQASNNPHTPILGSTNTSNIIKESGASVPKVLPVSERQRGFWPYATL